MVVPDHGDASFVANRAPTGVNPGRFSASSALARCLLQAGSDAG